jgi:hypothetical protein
VKQIIGLGSDDFIDSKYSCSKVILERNVNGLFRPIISIAKLLALADASKYFIFSSSITLDGETAIMVVIIFLWVTAV